jgi:hypothetical protein
MYLHKEPPAPSPLTYSEHIFPSILSGRGQGGGVTKITEGKPLGETSELVFTNKNKIPYSRILDLS